MPGKIIPFPQPAPATEGYAPGVTGLVLRAASLSAVLPPLDVTGEGKIHLVPARPEDVKLSTLQQAQMIVAQIRRLQKEQSTATQPPVLTERSPQFWATLPLPKSGMETPLSVARRLVHLLIARPA